MPMNNNETSSLLTLSLNSQYFILQCEIRRNPKILQIVPFKAALNREVLKIALGAHALGAHA